MNIFNDFNKTVSTNIRDYHNYNSSVAGFYETDDCIYLNGIPCDKYTLAPITFYKDKPLASMIGFNFYTSPITSTRYFNRFIGDGNKQQYRIPYSPNQTLLKNNARLSNQDEVIITPSSVPGAQSGKGNSVLYYNKNSNKITTVIHEDSLNYKPSMVAIDDIRYLAVKNTVGNASDSCQYGPSDASMTLFNKSTNSKSTINVSTYGRIHSVIGKTNDGDLILLNTISSGTLGFPTSTMAITKINKTTAVTTNLITTIISGTSGGGYNVSQEPAVNNDCSVVYFINPVAAGSTGNTQSKYTINKYSIDIANGTAALVPQTINLNGLTPYLKCIGNVQSSTNQKGGEYTSVKLTYLEFGINKYLVATNITNQASIPNTTGNTLYNPVGPSQITTNYVSEYMYLFKIVDDTLTLVDLMQTLGGSLDTPQAVFPVNNNKNFICVRYNGIDVLTVDTVNNKFLIQDTITDSIYSLGVDELERVWYVTSLDAMVNDAKLKVFSVGAAVVVNTDFQNSNYTYTGMPIDSNVIVSATDNTGTKKIVNLQLLIEGNAIFPNTSAKTINITTSSVDVLSVPIRITGDGMINIYTNITAG